jgi:hypothetical protein
MRFINKKMQVPVLALMSNPLVQIFPKTQEGLLYFPKQGLLYFPKQGLLYFPKNLFLLEIQSIKHTHIDYNPDPTHPS